MENLWAPWRGRYISEGKKYGCIFCINWSKEEDKKYLVLLRSENSLIMLNKFPYNSGHIMIAPKKHIPNLTDLNDIELNDLFKLLNKGLDALKRAFNPHGFNVGINIGRVAGAGFEDHVHIHVVPRWDGDTNFMSVLANTRVIPHNLENIYKRLYPILNEE
jgi:ATP adenylyltransferase